MPDTTYGAKPVRFIDDSKKLGHCLQELAAHETIAFDLEFDSNRNAYGLTLCLIQIASPVACYVIDPFPIADLGGVFALFENQAVQKIVHTPGEDLRVLHSLKCYPKNLFDTEVVARLLDYEQTSLAAILLQKLAHTMDKGQQKSNWLRRPLTNEQIDYAAQDVAWLHDLQAALVTEAEAKGLMPYVQEEQAYLGTTIIEPAVKDTFLKPADVRTMSQRAQYVLNELYRYRETLAMETKKPAYQVIEEDTLRAIADGNLKPEGLINAKGVYRGFKNDAFVAQLRKQLDAIKEAAADIPNMPTERVPQTAEQRAARHQADRDRTDKFAPIQQVLVQRFGVNAGRYLLSNTAVNHILSGNMPLAGIEPAYRLGLIRDIAVELGLDIGRY